MLSTLLSEPILGRLFFASVEMTVLAGLVWAAIRSGIVRSPRWRSLLWLLVLAKPFVVVTLGALLPVLQVEVAPPVNPASHEAVGRESTGAVSSAHNAEPADAVEEDATWVEEGNAGAPTSIDSVPLQPRLWVWPWGLLRLLLAVWVVGVFVLGAYVAFDRICLWRLIASARLAPNALWGRYCELAGTLRVGKPPRLRVTKALESPALAGVLRPTILLPGWLADKAWNAELEWSLRHELAHWKLGDSLANAARQAAQVFFFFHPVTWWAGRKWQEAAELACDRAVVHTESEVEDYAGNLYQVLAKIHGQRQSPLASGLFATRTQIGRRIAVLLSDPLRYPARLGAWGLVVLMGVAAISLAVGSSFASSKEEAPATSEVTTDVQKNIQHAVEMLSTTSEFERDKVKAVVDIVRAQPNRPALAALCEWLKSDVATKRRSAVYIIGALLWEDASPAFRSLRDLLSHEEATTRGMAALTLATIGDSASYDAIVRMAREDADGYARRCAAWALGDLGDPKALEPLQAVSTDADPGVAGNAKNAIERLTFLREHAGATGDAKQVVRGIWLIAGSTPWDEERLGRAFALIRNADSTVSKTLLDEAAASPSTAIKNSARLAIERLSENSGPASSKETPAPPAPGSGQGTATPPASDLGADVQKSVQQAIDTLATTSEFERDKIKSVFETIRALPNRLALAALCEWLKSDVATKRRSAVYIIGALPWVDASSALAPLRDLLKHEEALTRGMAALTLATIGDAPSYDAMVHMAREDADAYARRCAAWALGDLGDPKALEPLQAASKDPDSNVASNAQNAIDRLTFLRDHADATGGAKQVVRGIWLVAGSTPWDEERLGRALAMIRSADPAVRKALLDEAAASPSEAIRNSVTYISGKIGNDSSALSGKDASAREVN
jgi:beta-lactamase regulating signal transducer with metallopeptidase domain/HEAT repeat protein